MRHAGVADNLAIWKLRTPPPISKLDAMRHDNGPFRFKAILNDTAYARRGGIFNLIGNWPIDAIKLI